MKRALVLVASLLCATSALAQLDIGRLIDYGRKAADAGGK
jgi:hypothetical protein